MEERRGRSPRWRLTSKVFYDATCHTNGMASVGRIHAASLHLSAVRSTHSTDPTGGRLGLAVYGGASYKSANASDATSDDERHEDVDEEEWFVNRLA